MVDARGLGRLGMLAVGLGIGAAVAHSPVAVADSSSDWLASVDSLLGGLSVPAETASSGLDIQISVDGTDLFSTTDNTATATSGQGDIAIAIGDGASANANGGSGDFAFADGSDASANAGGVSTDTGANNDTAIDIGTNSGSDNGAYAGNADLIGNTEAGAGTGSGDTAIDIGNNNGLFDGSIAGAGGLFGGGGNGDNDTAIDFGNNTGTDGGADAYDGNRNYASESGTTTSAGAEAGGGNDNTVIDATSNTTPGDGSTVGDGNGNFTFADGPANSTANAFEGNNNIAYILDPFGSTASGANAGFGGNDDLAAVLLTDGDANAQGGQFVYDIITALGNETGTAASTSGGFLSELLSLF